MQVQKDGKTGYRFGQSGHVYYGAGAEAKARLQERAAYAAGYKKDKKSWQEHYLFEDQELKRIENDLSHPGPIVDLLAKTQWRLSNL